MPRHTVATGIFLLMCAVPAAQSHTPVLPDVIPLPDGFGPEGIAVGNGATFYAGAALGSMPGLLGQILVGDLRTGAFFQLVAPTGRPALGMKFHSRSKLLFVAGGPAASYRDRRHVGRAGGVLSVRCAESNRTTDDLYQ